MERSADPSLRLTFPGRIIHVAAALFVVAFVAGCGGDDDHTTPEQRMAVLVEQLRSDPPRLAELLRRMPKGADLHSYLTGAARTESLIDWGIEDDLCVDTVTFVSSTPPGPRIAACG